MILSTTPNINITKLFCELHSILSLLPTAAILKGPLAAILEISVTSEQRRGELCHSISIQSTYFVRQLSVENVRAFIFVSVTPLYSSDGPFNMAAVGFSFPKIDAQSSPIFETSVWHRYNMHVCKELWEIWNIFRCSWLQSETVFTPRCRHETNNDRVPIVCLHEAVKIC